MAMTREAKAQAVSALFEKVDKAKAGLIFDYSGLNVLAVNDIRRAFRDADVEYRVVKNSLMKRALADGPLEALGAAFEGTTAVALKYDEEFGKLGKIAKDLAKKHKAFEPKAGFVEHDVIGEPRALDVMAALPTRDEARAQLLGVINAPAAKLLATINAPASHLIGVVQAKVDKEEGD